MHLVGILFPHTSLSSLHLVFGKIRVGTVSCHLSEVKSQEFGAFKHYK